MVNVQTPLVDMQFGERESVYVAHLERQLAGFSIREARFRALLEMLTDETWDDVELDIDNAGPQLMKVAEDTLVMRGLDRTRARMLVMERWNKTNKSLEDVSVNITTPVSSYDAKSALESYKERKANNDT